MTKAKIREAVSDAIREFPWSNYSFGDVEIAIEDDMWEWADNLTDEVVDALIAIGVSGADKL